MDTIEGTTGEEKGTGVFLSPERDEVCFGADIDRRCIDGWGHKYRFPQVMLMDHLECITGLHHGEKPPVRSQVKMTIRCNRRSAVLPRASKAFAIEGLSVDGVDDCEEPAIPDKVEVVFVEEGRRNLRDVAMQFPRDMGLGDVTLASRANGHEHRFGSAKRHACQELISGPKAVLVLIDRGEHPIKTLFPLCLVLWKRQTIPGMSGGEFGPQGKSEVFCHLAALE